MTMKLKHHHMLRGPRYRQARRLARRNKGIFVSGIVTTINNQPVPILVMADKLPEFDAVAEIEKAYPPAAIEVEGAPYGCPVCNATGDDPCVTKTGNKAKARHAGRNTL